MKRVVSVVLAGLVVLASGCNLSSGPGQIVELGVDKLEAPARSSGTAPLSVVVTVVTGGCTVFERFATIRSFTGANVTALGRDNAAGRDVACPQDVILTPHTLRFDPPFGPTFTVTVNRRMQEPLTATVQID